MAIKKIFNKKKTRKDLYNNEEKDGGSMNSENSNSSQLWYLTNNNNIPLDATTTSKSFQYSYNSNTNSLFSSKRTLATGVSTQPSSSGSYNTKPGNLNASEKSQITTIGQPLRVLDEEEQEVQFMEFKNDSNPEYTAPTDENKERERDIKEKDSKDREKAVKGNNSIRRLTMSEEISLCPTEHSNTSHQASSLDSFQTGSGLFKSAASSQIPKTENQIKYQLNEFIKGHLKNLANSITNTIILILQSVLGLTKASITISEHISLTYKTIKNNKYISYLLPQQFNTINSVGLRRIIKNIMHLLDNILLESVYNKSKALILKNLYDLFVLIKVIDKDANELINFNTYMSPKTFPIDSNVQDFPNFDKVDLILNMVLSKEQENEKLFADQDGSFIAPVLRGFHTSALSVITFIFGFPKTSKEHQDVIRFFSNQSPDFHFFLQKNRITLASASGSGSGSGSGLGSSSMKLKSPYRRIDDTQGYIPISMSLSAENATITSGTLGGYLYPKVPSSCVNPKLLKYKGQVFGLTCAHVVIANEESVSVSASGSVSGSEQQQIQQNHPNVSVPSPVLINLFKNALLGEMSNHSTKSPEFQIYKDAVNSIDHDFPMQKVNIKGKKVMRNLPSEPLGSIIWGERLINKNRLSDMAIIKVNENLKKKFINYLGEDLQLSQYDPALILSNLNVKRTLSLQPRKNGILNRSNLNVFKVGSTTGYTNGNLNGLKMIYWSDGSLRSSEFIIQSCDDIYNTSSATAGNAQMKGFANGGDSGAWVLSKLSDVNNIKKINDIDYEDTSNDESTDEDVAPKSSLSIFIESFIPGINSSKSKSAAKSKTSKKKSNNSNSEESGLGLLGMLHSYDGEFKQFGLFTPIDDILDRLEDVTGLEWGVVGCSEDGDLEDDSIRSSNSSNISNNSVGESDDDY